MKQPPSSTPKKARNVLKKYRDIFHPVLPQSLFENTWTFDLSVENEELLSMNLDATETMSQYIFSTLSTHQCQMGIGRYNEDRIIYQRSALFKTNEEPRTIHLGIDLWVPAGTPVFAPYDAEVHSFQDNHQFGDYGPTIILKHVLENISFHTLYGHLSRESLSSLFEGKHISTGEQLATIGHASINGNWPSHLHFQIILDMLEKKGDFPGVASRSKQAYYLALCPDPNLILNIPALANTP